MKTAEETKLEDLRVCPACLLAGSNGIDDPFFQWEEGDTFPQRWKELGGVEFWLYEGAEAEPHFSKSPCGWCGDTYAGDRWHVYGRKTGGQA